MNYFQLSICIVLGHRYGSFNGRCGFKNKNAQMELMSWFRRIELRGSRKLLSRLAQKRRKMMTIQITTRKGKNAETTKWTITFSRVKDIFLHYNSRSYIRMHEGWWYIILMEYLAVGCISFFYDLFTEFR